MTLADQLTVARASAVPFVVALFVWHFPGHDYWATGVFIAAMATDQIDGWLARRGGRTTALGSLLDPVADKLLVLSVLIVLIDQAVAAAVGGFAAAGAWSDSAAWWTLLVALVLTWVSGADYARVAPELLRGRAVA